MATGYTLRRSARARALRLAVYPDGTLVVTAPSPHRPYSGIRAIEGFVLKHAAWVERKRSELQACTVIRAARRDIPALKRRAAALANERCRHFALRYGRSYARISIRAQKARWGSCSTSGNLSFNYKLALLPARLSDYVVVHEICHLAHLDHSRAFWGLVEKTVPDHVALRRELRSTVIMFH